MKPCACALWRDLSSVTLLTYLVHLFQKLLQIGRLRCHIYFLVNAKQSET